MNKIKNLKNLFYFIFIFLSLTACGSGSSGGGSEDTNTGSVSAPENVQTTAGEGTITIEWNATQGATSYNVYWSTASGSGTNGKAINVLGTTCDHEKLIYGEDYFYVVTAVNGSGESLPSNEVTKTPDRKLISSVVFPDAYLNTCITIYAAINNAVYIDELTVIFCNPVGVSGVSDLTGVDWLTSLQDLSIYSNTIGNINMLANLTNLQKLNLFGNNIIDISMLTSLSNLQELNLSENIITNFSKLATFTNLEVLGLSSSNINDIGVLAGLTNLQVLYLASNNINDIGILAGLTGLQHLNLNGNNISDINMLANLTNLVSLRLNGNNISDISSLATLTNLQDLSLDRNDISDVSVLADLTSLQDLYLTDNSITTGVNKLTTLTNAYEIWLWNNPGIPCNDLDLLEASLTRHVIDRDYPPNCS